MVKVFFDIISGDEMVSDGYPYTEIHNHAGIEVQGKLVIKGKEDVGVSENLGEDEEKKEEGKEEVPTGTTVIDIVDRFGLAETSFNIKDFTAYIKCKHSFFIT